MIIVVCGGRGFDDLDVLNFGMREVFAERNLWELDPQAVEILTGGALGADTLAEEWARAEGITVREPLLPDWDTHGDRAGLIRNSDLVARADVVIAFPVKGSKGTWDTVRKAKNAGKPTYIFTKHTTVVYNPRGKLGDA